MCKNLQTKTSHKIKLIPTTQIWYLAGQTKISLKMMNFLNFLEPLRMILTTMIFWNFPKPQRMMYLWSQMTSRSKSNKLLRCVRRESAICQPLLEKSILLNSKTTHLNKLKNWKKSQWTLYKISPNKPKSPAKQKKDQAFWKTKLFNQASW